MQNVDGYLMNGLFSLTPDCPYHRLHLPRQLQPQTLSRVDFSNSHIGVFDISTYIHQYSQYLEKLALVYDINSVLIDCHD